MESQRDVHTVTARDVGARRTRACRATLTLPRSSWDPPPVQQRWLVVVGLLGLAGCQDAGPALSSTAQELVVLSPASYDFGTLTVGQTSPAFTELINPAAGNQYDTVTAITESCPDFTINAPGLPADVYRDCEVVCLVATCPTPLVCTTIDSQSYAFTATFRPSFAGTQSCVVTINLNNGALFRTITLSGTGMAPPIDIDVAPTSINFGDVRRTTTSSAANLAVRNLGGAALGVSNVALSGPYALSGPASFAVAPGGVQNLGITCTPTAIGQAGGNAVITSNDPTTPSVTVPLACNGIDSNLGISPSPAVFPTTRVGEPLMQTIALVNSGAAATTLQSVTLTGTGLSIVSGPAANTQLAGGTSVQVRIAFDAAEKGTTTGTLDVVTTDGNRTAQLTATAQLASMSVTPDGAVDFGPVCAGQTAMQAFTVLGNGDGSFQIQTLDDPAPPFTITRPALPASVRGSGANQVTFSVTASPIAEGVASSVIALATDIPGDAPRMIEVSVTGLAGGVSATPTELDLGSPLLDVTTIGQPVTVTNCTTDAITYSNARIEGADATSFAIVAQPTGTTIMSTGSAEWLVVLNAHTAGPKEATFIVDYPGGSASVPLTGEGLDPNALAPSDDVRSYYTCSTGSALASWPLGLALVLVARGRRRRRAR
jgi:hypothetical protein